MDAGTQVSRSEMWRSDAGCNASKKWTQGRERKWQKNRRAQLWFLDPNVPWLRRHRTLYDKWNF